MLDSSVDIPKFRENIRNEFSKIVDSSDLATNLEKGVFNFAIKEATIKKEVKKWENPWFLQLYTDRLRSIYINLKNPSILEQIKSGELLPQTFAFMTHQEMNPERWKELIEKKKLLDKNKYNTQLVARTDMFTCGKCKSKRCTYYTMQTRSADEPETIFITCLDCGKNWKR
jgi:transcription elongation factor S-II